MATAIRAAIMLTVLVGLPAAWVYYGPLPDGAQRVVDRFVAAAREAVGWGAESASTPKGAAPQLAVSPAMPPAPRFAASSSTPTPAARPAPSPAPPALAEQMEPLLMELRRLGALEYALEPWGADGRLFRFRCEMPLAAGDRATEQFEAIAPDPRATVQQVVADVSSWHAARVAGIAVR